MYKKLKVEALTNGASTFELTPGIYRGLQLSYRGAATAGEGVALAGDTGTVRILKDGAEKHNFEFDDMFNFVRRFYGQGVSYSLNDAGTPPPADDSFDHTLYVPFHRPEHGDVALIVRPGDLFQVEVTWGFAGDAGLTGSFQATGIMGRGVEYTPYELQWKNHNFVAGSGTAPHVIQQENISAFGIVNDSDITEIAYKLDDVINSDLIEPAVIEGNAKYMGRVAPPIAITTATPGDPFERDGIWIVDTNPSGSHIGALSNNFELTTTHDAGTTVHVLTCAQYPTTKKFGASISRRKNVLQRSLAAKAQRGAEPAVAAINAELS